MTLNMPNEEVALVIKKAVRENVKTRDHDIQHIKDWLQKQPHLPKVADEKMILTFLRGCKFSLEKTKKKLDMYYSVRGALPEFFSDRDISRPELQEVYRVSQNLHLPNLTSEGWRVCVLKTTVKGGRAPNVQEALKAILMIGDVRLMEETEGIAGDLYIVDAAADVTSFLRQLTPTLVKKFVSCIVEAYPVKFKGVHIINAPPIVDTGIAIFKQFLSDKLKKRIFNHRTIESLYEYVPRKILPEEYGGNGGCGADINNEWKEKLLSYTDWFKEQENIKADESLRPGKPKTLDDFFGISGSFRQISID